MNAALGLAWLGLAWLGRLARPFERGGLVGSTSWSSVYFGADRSPEAPFFGAFFGVAVIEPGEVRLVGAVRDPFGAVRRRSGVVRFASGAVRFAPGAVRVAPGSVRVAPPSSSLLAVTVSVGALLAGFAAGGLPPPLGLDALLVPTGFDVPPDDLEGAGLP
jgi:hypothetical protein